MSLLPGRRRSGDACPVHAPPPQLPSLLAISSLQQQQQDFVLYMSRVLLLAVVCKILFVLGLRPGWLVQAILIIPKRESIAEGQMGGEQWGEERSFTGLRIREKGSQQQKQQQQQGEEVIDDENSDQWRSLYDLGDDALSHILSFLSPAQISTCSCVSHRLRELCRDDHKVWLPMCERRWGSSTQVWSWVTNGSVPFKFLHTFLTRFENLVGFWRGVENGGHGNLVIFEWGPHNITGFRVLPATPGTFKVCKLPFVWIGLSRDGNPVCLMHLDSAHFVHPVNGKTTPKASESQPSSRPLQIPGNLAFSAGKKNPFETLGPDLKLEQELPAGVVVVDMHFVGNHHIVVEQLQQTQYPFMGKKKSLVEAAAVASFGSSENLVNFFGHTGGGSPGVNSEASSGSSDAGLSPPGSFPYEMYQFLARKVTSPGGDRAARKQQRRERDRAFSQGRHRCEPEHFVKIVHCCPTAARPLQGLWKAVSGTTGLDIVMLSYDDQGGVICRKMGNNPPGATMGTGSVYWTAKDSCMIPTPLPEIEQQNYECRFHNRPTCGHGIECGCLNCGSQDYIDEEVVGMLRATLNLDYCRLNNFMQGGPGRHDNEARVWQYASGRFGFGLMPSSQVLDFRPLCAGDGLADVGDYFF